MGTFQDEKTEQSRVSLWPLMRRLSEMVRARSRLVTDIWEPSTDHGCDSGGDIFDNDEEEEDLYYFDFDDPEDEEDSLDDGEEEEQEQKVQGRHTSPASVDMIYGIFYARFLPEQGKHNISSFACRYLTTWNSFIWL